MNQKVSAKKTIPNIIPSKKKTTAPVVDEIQRYYQFKKRPAEILKILDFFQSLQMKLKKRKIVAWILSFVMALATYASFLYVDNQHPEYLSVACFLAAFGFCIFIIVFLLCKVISKSRAVNPSDLDRSRAIKKFGIVLISGFFIVPIAGNIAYSFFEPIRNVINFSTPGLTLLCIFAPALFTIFLLSQVFAALRYGYVTPRPFEAEFCNQILRPLLQEVPSDLMCSVIFNPFPSQWSQTTIAPLRGAKEATLDCILKARLPLGADRTVSVSVVHRISQKGQRKFKGYKHKVKTTFGISDPMIDANFSRTGLNSFGVNKPPSDKDLIKSNPFGFVPAPPVDPMFEGIDGKILGSYVTLKVKSFSPNLSASDLIHPNIILWKIKALSEYVTLRIANKKP